MKAVWQYAGKYLYHLAMAATILGALFAAGNWYKASRDKAATSKELQLKEAELLATRTEFRVISDKAAELAVSYEKQLTLGEILEKELATLKLKKTEKPKAVVQVGIKVESKPVKTGPAAFPVRVPVSLGIKTNLQVADVEVRADGSATTTPFTVEQDVLVAVTADEDGKVRSVATVSITSTDPRNGAIQTVTFPPTSGSARFDPAVFLPRERPLATETKFVWGAFNLNIAGQGMATGGRSAQGAVGLDVNFAGFGRSKQDLDWKLMHLGAAYGERLSGYVLPFSYRPLKDILTNTYIGPGYYLALDASHGPLVSLSVGL